LQTRFGIIVVALLMLAACSKHQPPVQMMAEARAAIQAAHALQPSSLSSSDKLEQADRALQQATLALSNRHYSEARSAAKTARDLARQAIKMRRHTLQHSR